MGRGVIGRSEVGGHRFWGSWAQKLDLSELHVPQKKRDLSEEAPEVSGRLPDSDQGSEWFQDQGRGSRVKGKSGPLPHCQMEMVLF